MNGLPLSDALSPSLENLLTTEDGPWTLVPWPLLRRGGRRLAAGAPLFLLRFARSIGTAAVCTAALVALGKFINSYAKVRARSEDDY